MNRIYNVIKLIIGISALIMSFEYYFFWIQYGNYYYIADLVAWFLFSAIMIAEAFIGLVNRK